MRKTQPEIPIRVALDLEGYRVGSQLKKEVTLAAGTDTSLTATGRGSKVRVEEDNMFDADGSFEIDFGIRASGRA